ncbi:MAG: FKBP-type peptidyl-prolyl cis-trans isomerase [Elusimicrobia bacterium]|nr:FKBP-type peptidyl-prolyl cis-trans isomerase [Elusimicrobiota bacterium]
MKKYFRLKRAAVVMAAVAAVFTACGERMVKEGDKIKVHFEARLADGTLLDASREGVPLELVVGSGKVPDYFDREVRGLKVDETKTVTIKAAEIFGERDETAFREIPKSSLPENFVYEVGRMIKLRDPESGKIIERRMVEIKDDSIVVDFNHPLAGQDFTYKIKVVEIE